MTYAMTQTKGLVASIGATAAFTALITGGVIAANQAGAATSDGSGTGDTIVAPQTDPTDSTTTDQSSDHCKIPKGAVDELGHTPNPTGNVDVMPSDHISDSDFSQRYIDGALRVKAADITNPNGRICEWTVDITTNAVKHDTNGDQLKDDVTLTANSTYGKDPWLIVSGQKAQVKAHARVYYTPDQPTKANEAPADATLIGETDLDFNSADTQTASIAKPASLGNGYITWVWSVDKNSQPADWQKFLVASTTDGWAADNEVAQHPSVAKPTPTPTETTPTPAPSETATPAPTPSETTPAPTPKPTPYLPDHDGVTPPAPAPTPAPTTDGATPTPTPSETAPSHLPEPEPLPSETTPAPSPSETTPAPIVPTPGETTPAPAPSTPGEATTDPTPAPNGTTEAPTPNSQGNGDKDGKGVATNSSTNGTENGNGQGNNQTGTKAPAGSTSVNHQEAALAHTGSTTLPLLGGASLLLIAGAGLALTKRAKA